MNWDDATRVQASIQDMLRVRTIRAPSLRDN